MHKLFSFAAVFCFSIISVFSQALPRPASSFNLVDQGIKLHDDGKFEEAIALYSSVSRSDSAYFVSLIEKALSLLSMDRDEEVIKVCETAMKIPGVRAPEIYNMKGTALDNLGRSEEAIAVYNEGLKFFPYYLYLNVNKGLTLQKMNRLTEAVKCFQDALRINPFHLKSHLQLGYISAHEGKYTQAMLSFDAYLCIVAADTNALNTLTFIDRFATQKNDLTPDGNIFTGGDDFSNLDMILENHIGMNSSYKLRIKLDFPFIRQTQVMLDNLKYNPDDKGFWNQFYVPFFLRILNEDKLNTFILRLLASSHNEKISAAVNKKLSEVIKFNDWTSENWSAAHEYIAATMDGKELRIKRWLEKGKLVALGNEASKDKNTGYWIFIHNNGAISSCGNYDDNGERTGKWNFYHSTGNIKNKAEYVNGKLTGTLYTYDEMGRLNTTEPYIQGIEEGLQVEFFPSGDTSATVEMKNDFVNGPQIRYYPVKTIQFLLQKKDSKFEGLQKKFNDNGQLSLLIEYKDDKRNGTSQEYYYDGQLSSKYIFRDDLTEGPYALYYPDGTVKESGTTVHGEQDGILKSYHKNGILSDLYKYSSGKLADTSRSYDTDGIMYNLCVYDKEGALAKAFYFDKTGRIISQSSVNKKKLALNVYYSTGEKAKEGIYENNKLAGTWKYYAKCGALASTEEYLDGKLNGQVRSYFRNGALRNVTQYSSGKMEGQFTAYFSNGKSSRTGWDVDDNMEGDWYFYYPDGTLEQHLFYAKGEQVGWQQSFDTHGRLDHEFLIKDGKLHCDFYFDTLGQVYDSVVLQNGSGQYISHSPDEATRLSIHYLNGVQHGDLTEKNIHGITILSGSLFDGKETGKWSVFNHDGSLFSTRYYSHGEKDSIWTFLDESGKLYRTETYDIKRNTVRITKLSPTGVVTEKLLMADDEIDGEVPHFDPLGEPMFTMYYKEGVILGYSYPDVSGKPVKMIPLPDETGKVTAYFKSGKKSAEFELNNGWYVNSSTYYYSNGNIWKSLNYKENDLSGPCSEYYPDGKIFHENVFLYDQMHGLNSVYYTNGKLKQSVEYRHGNIDGLMQEWNDKGELIHTYIFRDNVLLEGK